MRRRPGEDLGVVCQMILSAHVRVARVERRALAEAIGSPVAVFEADRMRAVFAWSMRGLS